jgi:hypothetical protein
VPCLEKREIELVNTICLKGKRRNIYDKQKIILRENIEPKPTLTTYILDDTMEKNTKRPAVLVCPGGGYRFCSPREAEPIAVQYNAA